MRTVRTALLALAALLLAEFVVLEVRHTTEPVALEPHCTIWRISHPDPRRRTRIVSSCHPLDTTFVPR